MKKRGVDAVAHCKQIINLSNNEKKRYNVLKKYIPLHRFNKQMIVLQI